MLISTSFFLLLYFILFYLIILLQHKSYQPELFILKSCFIENTVVYTKGKGFESFVDINEIKFLKNILKNKYDHFNSILMVWLELERT